MEPIRQSGSALPPHLFHVSARRRRAREYAVICSGGRLRLALGGALRSPDTLDCRSHQLRSRRALLEPGQLMRLADRCQPPADGRDRIARVGELGNIGGHRLRLGRVRRGASLVAPAGEVFPIERIDALGSVRADLVRLSSAMGGWPAEQVQVSDSAYMSSVVQATQPERPDARLQCWRQTESARFAGESCQSLRRYFPSLDSPANQTWLLIKLTNDAATMSTEQ
jgi:hypothetical protein